MSVRCPYSIPWMARLHTLRIPRGWPSSPATNSVRAFSTTQHRNATWGFVGLGQMGMCSQLRPMELFCVPYLVLHVACSFADQLLVGYNMAKNLRAKIPADDTLIVHDVNEEATKRFVAEAQETAQNAGLGNSKNRVEIANNAREVAEKSVSVNLFHWRNVSSWRRLSYFHGSAIL